jgi:hypothetical protein
MGTQVITPLTARLAPVDAGFGAVVAVLKEALDLVKGLVGAEVEVAAVVPLVLEVVVRVVAVAVVREAMGALVVGAGLAKGLLSVGLGAVARDVVAAVRGPVVCVVVGRVVDVNWVREVMADRDVVVAVLRDDGEAGAVREAMGALVVGAGLVNGLLSEALGAVDRVVVVVVRGADDRVVGRAVAVTRLAAGFGGPPPALGAAVDADANREVDVGVVFGRTAPEVVAFLSTAAFVADADLPTLSAIVLDEMLVVLLAADGAVRLAVSRLVDTGLLGRGALVGDAFTPLTAGLAPVDAGLGAVVAVLKEALDLIRGLVGAEVEVAAVVPLGLEVVVRVVAVAVVREAMGALVVGAGLAKGFLSVGLGAVARDVVAAVRGPAIRRTNTGIRLLAVVWGPPSCSSTAVMYRVSSKL